jgi:hypothetical protein
VCDVRDALRYLLAACANSEYLVHEFYKPGTTSSVKEVNEPVLLFLTVSEIFNVHLPRVLVFDDEGAVGTIKPFQPLSYYDLTSTQGKWTLRISDTVKNSKTGSFASFTLDVVPVMPAL